MEDPRGDMEHQAPPSLWPIGFAVGIVCLLVGLIVSWVAAAVGAVIAAVFGFLWVRDVVAAGRHEAPAVPVETDGAPPSAPPLPAQEGGPAMPPPEPAERFPRSVFLEGATLGLGAIIGAIVTLPVLGFAVLPAFVRQSSKQIDLGPLENFPEGQYVVATFPSVPDQGVISGRTAFIRNNGTVQGKPSFTCISNRCVHLGCPVQAGGPVFDAKSKNIKTSSGLVELTPALPAAGFICPCHGGAYDQEGNRTAGPPVRALNRYQFLIKDGNLILDGTFSVGSVSGTGATARIHKYQTAGPGQHVDGPEAWLYPVQPPH
ncbi:MAG TPA: Rieske 2Fe-2S domain-containing protein [Gaiellaceae bacterium]